MALPKEPRQKMINMMYLVLTALLALNVSSEILNAFVTVNNSINKSNHLIDDKNELTFKSFAEKLKDPQTQAMASVWAPKADQAKKLSDDLYDYIEGLKTELQKQAGTHENHTTGKTEINADNLDAAIRLMDKMGKGKELYTKLGDFKKNIVNVLNPDAPEFANNPREKETLRRDVENFQKSIPVDITVPESHAGNKYSNDANG